MTMKLKSYVCGRWHEGAREGALLRDATTGAVVAQASTEGVDFRAVLDYARRVGGPALRELTFHQRAALVKQLAKFLTERKEEFYALSYATGATKGDSWIDIDGGIGTLFVFASKGARELPDSRVYVDGAVEALSKTGTFIGQHICTPLEGAAVHINAFNFPVWGMLEKLAPTLMAGVPAIVKPATATSYLTELVVRRIVESGILPPGSLQLLCGSAGDLFDHLDLPGRRGVHGLGEHGVVAAAASERDRALGAVHGGDGFAELVDPRAGRGGRHAGVRSVRARSRARDDGESGAEVHGHSQGHRAGGHRGCRDRGVARRAREGRRG